MRKEPFEIGEYYHVYNRGVDKRRVFLEKKDFERFLRGVREFNSIEPIGSMYWNSFSKTKLRRETSKSDKLVGIIVYCLIPNHYHFILKEIREGGISEFMKRLGGGYTKYFNEKNKRSGVLFQGVFKSSHIKSDGGLQELSAYVNLNYKIHSHKYPLRRETSKWSSWGEYIGEVSKKNWVCEKSMILSHFSSKKEYRRFAEETIKEIVKQRKEDEGLDEILID